MNSGPPSTTSCSQQCFTTRPPSSIASRLSMGTSRDYRMKFMAGTEVMAINQSPSNERSSDRPTPATTMAAAPARTAPGSTTLYDLPPYWETPRHEDDYGDDAEDEAECHPFWKACWEVVRGVGHIVIGSVKFSLVIGHGLAKVLWHIPGLYADDTIWQWPEITDFPGSCKAALDVPMT